MRQCETVETALSLMIPLHDKQQTALKRKQLWKQQLEHW